MKHCRSQVWGTRYFGSKIPLSGDSQPDRDLFERIDDDLRRIMKEHRPKTLAGEVLKEMRTIQERFAASHQP